MARTTADIQAEIAAFDVQLASIIAQITVQQNITSDASKSDDERDDATITHGQLIANKKAINTQLQGLQTELAALQAQEAQQQQAEQQKQQQQGQQQQTPHVATEDDAISWLTAHGITTGIEQLCTDKKWYDLAAQRETELVQAHAEITALKARLAIADTNVNGLTDQVQNMKVQLAPLNKEIQEQKDRADKIAKDLQIEKAEHVQELQAEKAELAKLVSINQANLTFMQHPGAALALLQAAAQVAGAKACDHTEYDSKIAQLMDKVQNLQAENRALQGLMITLPTQKTSTQLPPAASAATSASTSVPTAEQKLKYLTELPTKGREAKMKQAYGQIAGFNSTWSGDAMADWYAGARLNNIIKTPFNK